MAEVKVSFKIAGLSEDHSAFLIAMREFAFDARQIPDIELAARDIAASGEKGLLQEYALVPTGPGAAWAIVKLAKLWLARDRHRSLQIRINRPDHEDIFIEATGESLSSETFEKAVQDALKSAE